MKLPNYSRVRLLTNKYNDENVAAGCIGYIIEIYKDAYEVEFSNINGETVAQIIVKEEDVIEQ
ncbi:MAG: DUF4926 domain-containing protein [Acidobacteria bacterium]|nr:DUF4926 domain-containing protein [Acidobacteriota bacterium]